MEDADGPMATFGEPTPLVLIIFSLLVVVLRLLCGKGGGSSPPEEGLSRGCGLHVNRRHFKRPTDRCCSASKLSLPAKNRWYSLWPKGGAEAVMKGGGCEGLPGVERTG